MPSQQVSIGEIARLANAENVAAAQRLLAILSTTKETNADVATATEIRGRLPTTSGNSFSDIRVSCRAKVCEVQVTLKPSAEERTVINNLAAERSTWAAEFPTVDYIPMGTVDPQGRFVLWREVDRSMGKAPSASR